MDDRQAILNSAIAKAVGGRVVADGSIKLRIRCIAYPESTKHYADAVVVSATALTLYVDGAVDSNVGASGVLAFATYTTLGTLVDAINISGTWEAEIVAGLRSDTVSGSELLARSTSTFRMYEEISLYADSSDNGVYKVSYLLEPGQAFEYVRTKVAPSYKTHRVGLQRLKGLINTNAGEAIYMTAYELKPDKASALKTSGTWEGTDNIEKDTGATDDVMVHAGYGNSILIDLYSTGTGWIDSGAYLEVQGKRE